MNIIYKTIYILTLLFLFTAFLFPQETGSFKVLNTQKGLSQNSVFSILQDKNGLMWFGTRDGLNKFDGYNVQHFYAKENNPNSLYHNQINSIIQLNDSILAIGTAGGVNLLYLSNDRIEKLDIKNPDTNEQVSVEAMCKDSTNNLWIADDYHLIKYELDSKTRFATTISNKVISNNSLYCDVNNDIWICTYDGINIARNSELFPKLIMPKNNGVPLSGASVINIDDDKLLVLSSNSYVYDKKTQEVETLNSLMGENELKSIVLRKAVKINNHEYYLSSAASGIFHLNFDTKSVNRISYLHHSGIGFNNVLDLIIDKNQNFWAGTNGSGVLYWNKYKGTFKLYNSSTYPIKNKSIRAIYKDRNNILWIGGYSGLESIDLLRIGEPNNSSITNQKGSVRTIVPDHQDSSIIWIGYEQGGVRRFNSISKRFIDIADENYSKISRQFSGVYSLIFQNEKLLLGTGKGLFTANSSLTQVNQNNLPDSLKTTKIFFLYKDRKESIWVCAQDLGIMVLDNKFNIIDVYKHSTGNVNSISSNNVFSVVEDSEGNIWAGTEIGLNKIYRYTGKVKRFSMEDGLPNNTVYGVLSDDKNVWMSTNNGIAKINVNTEEISQYGIDYGLQDKEFNTSAFYKSADGELFFGGILGINSFYPSEMASSSPFPKLLFTSFFIYNDEIYANKKIGGRVVLKNSITHTKGISLNYDQNTITIGYAALEYFDNNNIKYKYILENYEENWNEVNNRKFATYSKLPIGEYVFKVKSTNNEGLWNSNYQTLTINIKPPIWRTWFAYFLYSLLLALALSYFLYRNQQRFEKKKKELEKEKEISEQLRQVDRLKDNFLAQISHEVRTPINSILSFTSLIESEVREGMDEDLSQGFDSIKASGKRIIRTIDLILNLSQVQTRTYEARITLFDLYEEVIKEVVKEYKVLASKKNLDLSLNHQAHNTFISADHYSVTQIFANLVENAIKYTHEGSITLKLYNEKNFICVDIADTGIGISKEFIPKLFQSFTQESQGYTRSFEGNGLGLALVKKYCELNKAEISVKSKKGSGTTFTVKFPSV